jgi:hypothetical protein
MALVLAPHLGRAQVTLVGPGVNSQGQAARQSDANYGPPRVADLDVIVIGDGYQRAHVITEGEVSPFQPGQYWRLGQVGATVLLIPGRDFDAGELDRVTGRRTEVRGIVRLIRKKEYAGRPPQDLDLLEDPLLPPMPPPMFDQGWPRISITVFAIRDRTGSESSRRPDKGGGLIRQILDEPSAYSGKTARIYGQFRGRNLFSDLPANSARGKDDWVLKDGDTAMWVIGKTPKGEGWKLDLDYRGDSKSWLEVEGKPEVVNGVVYLKASRVLMSKAPASTKAGVPPR